MAGKTVEEALAAIMSATGGGCGNLFIRRNDGPLSAEWVVEIDYDIVHGTGRDSDLARALELALANAEYV